MKFGMGQALRRSEDTAILMGQGRYVADVAVRASALAAFVVRVPHAHARFAFANLELARAMPGVQLLLTRADVADPRPIPAAGCVAVVGEGRMWRSRRPVLCTDLVRHVGDPVAFIVAGSPD